MYLPYICRTSPVHLPYNLRGEAHLKEAIGLVEDHVLDTGQTELVRGKVRVRFRARGRGRARARARAKGLGPNPKPEVPATLQGCAAADRAWRRGSRGSG